MPTRTKQADEQALQWAVALHQKGQVTEARSLYEEILRSQPSHLQATFLIGLTYAQQNNFEPAAKFFGKAAKLNPAFVDAHFNCGLAYQAMKQQREALQHYDRTLRLKPDHADALYNRGVILHELRRHDEALQSLDKALKATPNRAEAESLRGAVLSAMRRFEEALRSYDRAIHLQPNYAEAYANRGAALQELRLYEEALRSTDRAIQLRPDYAEAYATRGAALTALKRFEEALKSLDRTIQLMPTKVEAYANRGAVLAALKRSDEALANYDRAIQIKPDYAEAHSFRGILLRELNRWEEAIGGFDRAIKIKPDYAEAYANRGVTLRELNRFEEAIENLDRAIKIKPQIGYLPSDLLHTRMIVCDWTAYSSSVGDILGRVSRGEEVAEPFTTLALPSTPELQRRISEIWVNARYPANGTLGEISRPPTHQKIRIGYFSTDFHDHPVALSIIGLLEGRDRSRFEIFAFSFGPDSSSEIRQRLQAAFDKFIDVRTMSDRDVALLSRKLEIDIAIDLSGFTRGARTGVFAMRAAPIQLNYLGYPNTMGADYIDYLIADPTIIPASHQPHYREKIVYLPNSFFPSDRKRQISDKVFTRPELGLPPEGFVFCCFNNNYKIIPDVFDSWMRILGRFETSVLWLRQANEISAKNLKKQASARGIDPDRLIFAPRMPLPEHLARHRLADLFLDTLPYNAHSTASDALWAGLPVLTQIGETFATRVAASLLKAVDLPELVTTTREEYEALAIELAANPVELAALKQRLDDNRLTTPLFDTGLLIKHVETAYATIYERYRADLPPDHIYVPL